MIITCGKINVDCHWQTVQPQSGPEINPYFPADTLNHVIYKCMAISIGPHSVIYNVTTEIRNVLYKYGFGHVWLNQGVEDIPLFLELLKQITRYILAKLALGCDGQSKAGNIFHI